MGKLIQSLLATLKLREVHPLGAGALAILAEDPIPVTVPIAMLDCTKQTTGAYFAVDNQVLIIEQQAGPLPEPLTHLATQAVESIADLPRQLLFLLAYTAITREEPSEHFYYLLDKLCAHIETRFPNWNTPAPSQTDTMLRNWAVASLTGEQGLLPLSGPWNIIRAHIYLGQMAWQLPPGTQRWWASYETPHTQEQFDAALDHLMGAGVICGLASLFIPAKVRDQYLKRTPNLLNQRPETLALWSDVLALELGPAPPPADLIPEGIGFHYRTPFEAWTYSRTTEALTLPDAALLETASVLLHTVDRPVPRYLGQLIDVAVPADLLRALATWQISKIRVQPQAGGLWVAFWTNNPYPRVMAATWWGATATSARHTPITLPSSAWVMTHLVLAALWYDLCADAITLTTPGPTIAPSTRPQQAARRARKRRTTVTLPPIRHIAQAQWAEAADRQLLQKACAVGHGYRRLPPDWQNRSTKPATRRCRSAACTRAAAYQCPPPPPGFTFVKPYLRGADLPTTPPGVDSAPRVRARGLFTLLLTLQGVT